MQEIRFYDDAHKNLSKVSQIHIPLIPQHAFMAWTGQLRIFTFSYRKEESGKY